MRMRISRILLLCALVALSSFTVPAWSQTSPANVKFVVLPFEINADKSLDYLDAKLPELLSERLRGMGFQVASQDEVSRLIASSSVDYVDTAVAKALSVRGNAQFAVYGSLSQVGQSISIDARLVDATGIKPTKAIYVTKQGTANVLPALEELARKIKNTVFVSDTITEIDVRGTNTLDKDVVLMRMKLQKGDVFDPAAVKEEIKRIYELGYFDDVKISTEDMPEGKRLVVDVVEKPRIQAITVQGASDIDEDDVKAVMSTKTGSVLNPKLLADDLGKIRELYRKEGYYLTEVSHSVENTGKGTARLVITVDESDKLYISEIKIEGNETFSDGDLEDVMALSERNWFSWITGTGVLQEELLDRDAAAIEDYYANHGFIGTKVGQPQVDFTEDGIHITFQVQEGERYKVGEVSFKGDLLVSPEELSQYIQLDDMGRDGDWFSRKIVREDSQTLSVFYNDYGYAYADAEVNISPNEESKTLDVVYTINKGEKVYIRRVTIEGNTKTRDNVIRREMEVNDGDMFSGSQLRLSNQRLEKLDLFESADIETVPTEDPNQMDLKVKVKEKSTGTLSGGIGYSSYSGVYVGGKLSEKNLFGMGYELNLQAAFSAIDTNYIIGFTNPALFDSKLAAGVDLYYTTYEYPDFDKQTIGGTLRFSYPLGNYTRLFWGYRLDQYRVHNVHSYAADEIRDMEGDNWSSVLTLSALRDTTNRNINPSQGSKNSVALEYGGGLLMGDDNFIKTVADSSWYWEMPWFKEHIIHAHGQAGFLFDQPGEGTPPVFEHFFLGGMQSIRGYETRKIGTRDPRTNEIIGGDKEWFVNLEYIFPLYQSVGLVGVAFFDAGDSWRGDISDMEVKKSVGAGLRWFSPMGPLRLEYAYGMDTIYDQDSHHKIEFSIGQFF